MRRSPAAANTRHVEHSRFGGFYRWVQIEYKRPDNPTDRANKPRRRRTLPRPVGEADLSIAIQLAEPFSAAVLTLAGYAGLRACEIATLRGENILLAHRMLIVHEGKGGNSAALPIHTRQDRRTTRHMGTTHPWLDLPAPR